MEILQSTFAGAVLGMIFYKLKLPIPAPPVLAGIIGLVGVLIGGKVGAIVLNLIG